MNQGSLSCLHSSNCNLFYTDLLRSFLNDKTGKYCDVILISNDGKRFPTNRGILGARCSYFSSLLFSSFKESQESEISINLSSDSVNAVLEYMLSGKFVYENSGTPVDAQVMIRHRNVADYIESQGMYDLCTENLGRILGRNKELACLIFDALCNEPRKSNVPLFEQTVEMIQRYRNETVVSRSLQLFGLVDDEKLLNEPPRRITWLSKKGLDCLFKVVRRTAGRFVSERVWFHLIREWFVYHEGRGIPRLEQSCVHGLTDQLRNEELSIEFLACRVEPSGLMSAQKISNAYKYHATQSMKSWRECQADLNEVRRKLADQSASMKLYDESIQKLTNDLKQSKEENRWLKEHHISQSTVLKSEVNETTIPSGK